jgi:hypothetical protein
MKHTTPFFSFFIIIVFAIIGLVIFFSVSKPQKAYDVSQSVEYNPQKFNPNYYDMFYFLNYDSLYNTKFVLTTSFYYKRPNWIEFKKDYCKTGKEVDSLKSVRLKEAMQLAKEMYELNKSSSE